MIEALPIGPTCPNSEGEHARMLNWKLILSLFLPFYAMHCLEQMYFLMGPMIEAQGISPQVTGWVLGIFFVGVVSFRPIGGWALERLGVRKTLIFSSSFGVIGSVLLALFSTSVPMLLIARLLTGFSFGGFVVAMLAHQALVIPAEMKGAAFALITTGGMLPMATVGPLAEWLLRRGHPAVFLWMGPVLALVCLYLGSRVGTGDVKISAKKEVTWGKYRDLIKVRPYLLLGATALPMSLVDASVMCMASLATEYNLIVSFFLSSAAIAGVLLRIAGSRFLDRLPREILIAPALMMMSGGILWISLFPCNKILLLGGALFGAGIGMGFPVLLSLISDLLGKKLQPKGTVAIILTFDMGWILTPLIVGYASSVAGIAWTFRLLALIGLMAALSTHIWGWLPLHRRRKRKLANRF